MLNNKDNKKYKKIDTSENSISMDIIFMDEAIKEARKAASLGEVPVGCIIVSEGKIIGRGKNLKETLNDPSAHAEVIAIKDATNTINNWRLNGATIYITLEPCPMCASLITQARISRAVIGYPEYQSGAFGSKIDLSEDIYSHHRVHVDWRISEDIKNLMDDFFANIRNKKNNL